MAIDLGVVASTWIVILTEALDLDSRHHIALVVDQNTIWVS